jgi:S1-C subfamily serine protease
MDRIGSCRSAVAWIAAVSAFVAGSARAAVVVPVSAPLDMQAVADRVHSLAVAVRARAFVSDGAPGGRGHLTEAVTSASGVLIGDGLVLTTLSSVALSRGDGHFEPAESIDVVANEVGLVPALLVMGDPALDLAVLQLPEELRGLDGATFAPRDPLVGDEMLAIGAEGNSLYVVGINLEQVEFAAGGAARLYADRPVPPSFSGGPLFDGEGRLAGLTTPGASDSGFAVPASVLRALIDRLAGATRI